MKTNIFILGFAILFIGLPYVSSAYFTTEQSATQLSPNTAMFTITYKFGNKAHDVYMPIFTKRDLEHNANTGQLGYEILDDNEVTTAGETTGIVLSKNASIKDGMYYLPAGIGATFTLVQFLVLEDDTPRIDASLHVQELPFYFDDAKDPLKLNPSELQYYVTPEVTLNKEVSQVISGSVMTLSTK